MQRNGGNIGSPCRVTLGLRWLSSDPGIRQLRLFPHGEAAEFTGFLGHCLETAASKIPRLPASERCQLQIELGLHQCVHSFSIITCPLSGQLKLHVWSAKASLHAKAVLSNRQELSCQRPF